MNVCKTTAAVVVKLRLTVNKITEKHRCTEEKNTTIWCCVILERIIDTYDW